MSEIDVVSNYPVSLYQGLASNAFVVDSGELVKSADLGILEKVPFVITAIAYRRGEIKPKGATEPNAYVSVTATIADEPTLEKLHKFKRINLDELMFMPEESIVFNDGSTGVKRQVTEFLHTQEYIRVAPQDMLKIGGPAGESSFDLAPHYWEQVHTGNLTWGEDESGKYAEYETHLIRPIHCRRGLRSSEYANAYTQEGVTWYLA